MRPRFYEPWEQVEEPEVPEDAVCPDCGVRLTPENVAKKFEGVADAPDGLPAPIMLLMCRDCHPDPEGTR